MIITDYKPVGITCGQLIKKKCYSKFTEIAYVGILDPMARGIITILTDKDLSKMDEYMKRSKTYIFKFIIGTNTDTDDILGIHVLDSKQLDIELETIIDYINNFSDSYIQKYHKFSAYKPKKRLPNGTRKPLWWWTSNGYEISETDIPSRKVKIADKTIVKIEKISGEIIKEEFIERINKIEEDKFRKGETLMQWKSYEFNEFYDVFTCKFTVSSGFYIRQFVRDMSDALGVKLIVIDIERVEIL
jgi:tRNA pseudouridine(55) synthase